MPRRAALALIACASLTHAQPAETPPHEPPEELAEEPSLPFWVETRLRFVQHTDASLDSGGNFSMARANAEVRFLLPLSRSIIIDTDIGYEYSDYEFDGTTGLGSLDPWGGVSNLHIRPLLIALVREDLALLAAPIFDFSGEHDADLGDTFTLGGVLAFRYEISDDLAIGLGIQVNEQLEDDIAVYPTFLLHWQATDSLVVRNNDFNLGAHGGTGIEAMYSLSEQWRVGAGFQAQIRQFRLDDDGIAPGGVGREFTVPIYARVDYVPHPKVVLSGFAGSFVAGNVELLDNTGNTLADEDYDPSFGIGLQIQARF